MLEERDQMAQLWQEATSEGGRGEVARRGGIGGEGEVGARSGGGVEEVAGPSVGTMEKEEEHDYR